MFLGFLFIIRLTGVEAPSGDQVLGINMSSQKGEHRHFDSYTHEPRLHLTPASHLLSRSAPVLTQCEARSCSCSSVYTCPTLAATHHNGKEWEGAEDQGNLGKGEDAKTGNWWRFSVEKLGWSNGNAWARLAALWCRGNIDAWCDLTCNASLNLRKWNKWSGAAADVSPRLIKTNPPPLWAVYMYS